MFQVQHHASSAAPLYLSMKRVIPVLTIILGATSLFMLLLLFFTYRSQARYKNELLFAVKVPARAIEHFASAIEAIQARFSKRLRGTAVTLFAALLPLPLLHNVFSFQMVYFFIWTFAAIALLLLPFRTAFRETLELKRATGGFAEPNGDGPGERRRGLTNDDPDGDEYWANGLTYHNPNDERLFVPKRVGVGETINTGRRAGKVVMGMTVGITAAVVIGVCFMMIRSEISTPVLTLSAGQRVEIDYPMYSFAFDLERVEQVELVDELPSGTKTNGEATSKYARGHFRLKELGKSRMYVFKQHPPYIRIKLDDVYIFYNDIDPDETRRLFEQLRQRTAGAGG